MVTVCSGKTFLTSSSPYSHNHFRPRRNACTCGLLGYLAGSQGWSYFCCRAYQHSSLGPHNPSRSAKPSRRLHWNLHAILIEVHCTRIVVSGTKLKTLNASCRPQMAQHYTTCLTSFPCIKTSPSAPHCPRSLSAVYSSALIVSIKAPWSQARQHANAWASHQSAHTL